jgi:hypothetical protein
MEPLTPTPIVAASPANAQPKPRARCSPLRGCPDEMKRAVSVSAATSNSVLLRWMESSTIRPVDWLPVT